MKKSYFGIFFICIAAYAMENPKTRQKYLVKQEDAQQCDDTAPSLRVPRLTFMALMLEAYSNKDLDQTAFQQLLLKARHRSIPIDREEDAYCLTDRLFFNSLLAYIPWNGQANDCAMPCRYMVRLNNIKTSLTLGRSFWNPNQIKALAIEELSPGRRQLLIKEYCEMVKAQP